MGLAVFARILPVTTGKGEKRDRGELKLKAQNPKLKAQKEAPNLKLKTEIEFTEGNEGNKGRHSLKLWMHIGAMKVADNIQLPTLNVQR